MIFALLITLFAGMATAVGGIIATRKWAVNPGFTAASLGFAAGAILFISLTEILTKSSEYLELGGADNAGPLSFAAFFGGIIIAGIIDKLIPSEVNPDDIVGPASKIKQKSRLKHSALFVGIAITLHNIPEGFITFIGALDDPALGMFLAVAIAIHNIPEGIAVAAPFYAATKSKRRTIIYTALTGLAEPLGALAGYYLLRPFLTDTVFGVTFGIVAGIMVFIVLDEILPSAKRYETKQHQTTYAAIFGMLVMAISIAMLG